MTLKSGEKISALALGTWNVGGGYFTPDYSKDAKWVEAIKYAIIKGITTIDTAEMYGGGHAEELVGKAIEDFSREDVFIVSKVWPSHLKYEDVLKSAKQSVKRLSTYMDLYLIHAPNHSIPLKETIEAMEKCVELGYARYIGVSNFNVKELEQAMSLTKKEEIIANQVEYSLLNRAIENELLGFCKKNKILVMAYSPLAQGKLLKYRKFGLLEEIGKKYGATGVQVALNWVYSKGAQPIVKSENKKHIDEISQALNYKLKKEDIEMLDRNFTSKRFLFFLI